MNPPPRRTSSFGMLLRRSKSGESDKEAKKPQVMMEAPRYAPKLPEFLSNGELLSNSFGPELHNGNAMFGQSGYEPFARQHLNPVSTLAQMHSMPIRDVNLRERNESMTNRGRYSYASTNALGATNGPRRVRRRKDPTPFNILILGSRNAGKTSFLEFLKTALALPARKAHGKIEEDNVRKPPLVSGSFIPHYLETEMEGERIGLTLWDSEGLEKNIVDLQLREVSAFLENKFEETFAEEMKVVRSPNAQDTHIHATFLVLDPSRLDRNISVAKYSTSNGFQNGKAHPQSLAVFDDDLDVRVLRTLQHKTTVIPVISKADTITVKHMNFLKKTVWDGIKALNLDPLEGLGLEEEDSESDYSDEDGEDRYQIRGQVVSPPITPNRSWKVSGNSLRRRKAQPEANKEEETPFFPLSIISPDLYEPEVVGRQFAWGFADPYNEQHCDFTRLKEAVFTEWRAELREASREQWYEGWRTNRLNRSLPYRQ